MGKEWEEGEKWPWEFRKFERVWEKEKAKYHHRSAFYVTTFSSMHRARFNTSLLLLAENLFAWPREKSNTGKFWFISTWPLRLLLFATIPDTRCERLKNWYPLTFVMCVFWIAVASYLVSWMMTAVGDTIGIPDSIMGITFLAAGGNMPELASIVVLAKQGTSRSSFSLIRFPLRSSSFFILYIVTACVRTYAPA